jgi:hypothetical protein
MNLLGAFQGIGGILAGRATPIESAEGNGQVH